MYVVAMRPFLPAVPVVCVERVADLKRHRKWPALRVPFLPSSASNELSYPAAIVNPRHASIPWGNGESM